MADRGPQFLGIGAQRAGTTWVHAMLSRNPKVWLPPIKEVHYFDMFPAPGVVNEKARDHVRSRIAAWAKEPRLGRDSRHDWRDIVDMAMFDIGCLLGRREEERYLGLFGKARKAGHVTGEITPAYATLSPDAVKRVRALLGADLRVFIVLRDPIDRIWSHITKDYAQARGGRAPEAGRAELSRFITEGGARQRTRYADAIRTWTDAFGADNVLVAYFDEIEERPTELMARIEEHIGVPQMAAAPALPAINSYRRKEDGPPGDLLRLLAGVSLEETRRLLALRPSRYAESWLTRAEGALAGGEQGARP